jgi:hypothetical protein
MRSLNKDEQVHVKSLGVPGKVLRVRPGDIGEPEEQRLYEVQMTRYFRRADLDPEEESSKVNQFQRFSSEWFKEYECFIETGLRCQANPNDKNLMRQWGETGSRLGIFLQIE